QLAKPRARLLGTEPAESTRRSFTYVGGRIPECVDDRRGIDGAADQPDELYRSRPLARIRRTDERQQSRQRRWADREQRLARNAPLAANHCCMRSAALPRRLRP